MLLVRLASIADLLRAELYETVVEFAVRPVELWIGSVAQAKRRKPHVMQTARAQSGASEGSPEGLAVGGQLALAGGGDGDQDDVVLQQVLLEGVSRRRGECT